MDIQRVNSILERLNDGLIEREETVSMALLSILSGQSVFLYGPPGTAKSLIASRIASAFENIRYFEYLMQRFSTPEDVFGPISISELRNDNYRRMTDGFLPDADLAFLDEIWKSSPAILNTLLTIINEHKFRNGTMVTDVPLKSVIAASNEFPKENSGLDALYDRLLVRLMVMPVKSKRGFDRMITGGSADPRTTTIDPITFDEWFRVRTLSKEIGVSKGALKTIDEIRKRIERFNRESKGHRIYVSDRRWVNSVSLLRSAAYICGKKEVTADECILLKYCLWSTEEEYSIIETIISESVSETYFSGNREYVKWKDDFKRLSDEIESIIRPETIPELGLGFRKAQTSSSDNGETIRMDMNDHVAYIPVSLFDRSREFDLPVKDKRTGRTEPAHFRITKLEDERFMVSVLGEDYIVIMSEIGKIGRDESISIKRRELSEMERRLDRITESMRVGNDLTPSPFLNDDDRELIDGLRNGRSSETDGYRRRMTELRGLLDAAGPR